jgi:hypothetical protein
MSVKKKRQRGEANALENAPWGSHIKRKAMAKKHKRPSITTVDLVAEYFDQPSTEPSSTPAKLPWSTPVLTEMPYTDNLRRLYAATEVTNR